MPPPADAAQASSASPDAAHTAPRIRGQYAFPRAFRLLQTDGFSAVFSYKASFRSAHFQLSYRPGEAATPRFGVAVPKRIARRAVERNGIKRQAREAFRHARAGLPALDLVVRLIRKPESMNGPALRQEIEGLFARLARSHVR